MSRRHGLSGDFRRTLRLPQVQRLEQAIYHAFAAPQYQHVTGNLPALRPAIAVMLKSMLALAR